VNNRIPSKSFRKFLTTVVKYVVALGLLVVVVGLNWEPGDGGKGLRYVWEEHVLKGNIHWEYLALAGLICAASTLLTFVRWYFLVRAVGLPFRLSDAMRLGMIGFYFNTFLPGSVGGDILKAAFLAREQSRRTVAVATVIMDRVLGLWALFWFVALLGGICWMAGLVPEPAQPGCRVIMLIASATVIVGILGWGALGFLPDARAERFAERLGRLPRVGGAAAEFWRAVWMYRRRQVWVILSLLMSMVGFVGFVLTYYFSVLTLFDPAGVPDLGVHFVIVPIGLLIAAVPLLPGGIGLSELGFGGLYKLVGFTSPPGVLGSLMQRVINWGLALVGLLVYQRFRAALPQNTTTPTSPAVEVRQTPVAAAGAS
jgi:glycosyltransferase 2 family protein